MLLPITEYFNIPKELYITGKRIKECFDHVTSTVYICSIPNNHPIAKISHFKIIEQDSKQVARETREDIHIGINNHALNCSTGKMHIPEIFKCLLGVDRSSNESDQMIDSDLPLGHTHLTIPSNMFSRAVCLVN